MPDLVETSEGMNENIIMYRWAFGGKAETLEELRANFTPGQNKCAYLVGKDAYAWDADAADFILIGQWQGPDGPVGSGVPAGGLMGQVLIKVSDADYDTAWGTMDISSKADKTTVDLLSSTVSDHTTLISDHADQLAEKANADDVAAALSEKAEQADLDDLAAKVALGIDQAALNNAIATLCASPTRYSLSYSSYASNVSNSFYCKDALKRVLINLNVSVQFSSSADALVATLPSGYRPSVVVYAANLTGGASAQFFYVNTSGQIYASYVASGTKVAVGQIVFYAA